MKLPKKEAALEHYPAALLKVQIYSDIWFGCFLKILSYMKLTCGSKKVRDLCVSELQPKNKLRM